MSEPEAAASPSPPSPASPAVGRATEELRRIAELPVAEHPDVYQRIHAELQDALADIDDA